MLLPCDPSPYACLFYALPQRLVPLATEEISGSGEGEVKTLEPTAAAKAKAAEDGTTVRASVILFPSGCDSHAISYV